LQQTYIARFSKVFNVDILCAKV